MQSVPETEPPLQHVRLNPRCGACRYAFEHHDRIASLMVSSSSPNDSLVDAQTFPKTEYGDVQGQNFFHLSVNCEECAMSTETCTVHIDCLNLYMKLAIFSHKLDRLWTASVSVSPWPSSPVLPLPRLPANLERCLSKANELTGLGFLTRLPPELAAMILELCEPGELFRLCAVEDMVDILSETDDTMREPLQTVRSWHRGSRPSLTMRPSEEPIRVVIDANGIRSLERPPFSEDPAADRYYATITPEAHDALIYKYGFCQLISARARDEWPIWDIAEPPKLEDCSLFPSRPEVHLERLDTINLSGCSGLTFFMSNAITRAVHVHTPRSPTAEVTFKSLPANLKCTVIWIYVPISPSDPIKCFGTRRRVLASGRTSFKKCYYLFETSLAGSCTAGQPFQNATIDHVYSVYPDTTIIFNARRDQSYLCTGLFPRQSIQPSFQKVSPRTSPFRTHACYSVAKLDSVAGIRVYREAATRKFRGMIIDYDDGAQRALGDCRVGIDPSEGCGSLNDFHFALSFYRNSPVLEVVIGQTPEEVEEKGTSWTQLVAGGILEVWFISTAATMHLHSEEG
ncbi:hypothetical protein B0T11DRAFT_283780 [Plectosphaerella cucumerina]|uniref:F-box domain-containing protein n=1 Tax=Plectosphaerella cucumerina TaxID=40658 RepID=A0A8K0TGH0_9PEZI|nr:hypothetical protein B0T11DRAFT_283780 [Plectosphaerella cucumerina]